MKKLLLSTNVITLLALVSILCYYQSCTTGCNKTCPTCDTCDTCVTCYPNACDQSFTGLNAVLAKDMVTNYKNNQLQSIDNGTTVSDSRSVWLSLQTLKRFIHAIEKKVCDTCNTPLNELGVRIYYAAYPSATDWATYGTALNGVDQQNSQTRHTIVMVPTYFDGTNDIDFDPNYIGANCQPMTMCEIWQTKEVEAGIANLTVLTSGDVSMQNHGTMDPPVTVPTFAKVVDAACSTGGTVVPVRRDNTTR